MAEAGWHPKREARRFEPPPWEREQFDELERRKEAGEQGVEEPPAGEPVRARADAGPGAEPVAPTVSSSPAPAAGPSSAVPDAHVAAMLVQLKAEEPGIETHGRGVAVFSSAVMMFMGVCMLAWGGIAGAMAKGQITGAIGSMIVFVMGGLFAGTGLWLGLRATRRED